MFGESFTKIFSWLSNLLKAEKKANNPKEAGQSQKTSSSSSSEVEVDLFAGDSFDSAGASDSDDSGSSDFGDSGSDCGDSGGSDGGSGD
ncbi:MAG: hypothetical protein N3E45_14150 [Oscillatoriaceae bacterium SKW80]|nr:hypothetical protein [Oscillatoriaceae bacterium SKYG93]MCX8121942.1 hypothetical protein [Oscillatoriaceae bacterium SKW80]MDW8454228.1 hypothetical protein [Oscillatoriaceae cyanobacterium SKYGB_i_bin93]HIK29093.1 hypothetical protein [Oscillatoriaceae cyanobacterium M7585_C2015_266]